jgi:hypothetical protein
VCTDVRVYVCACLHLCAYERAYFGESFTDFAAGTRAEHVPGALLSAPDFSQPRVFDRFCSWNKS